MNADVGEAILYPFLWNYEKFTFWNLQTNATKKFDFKY